MPQKKSRQVEDGQKAPTTFGGLNKQWPFQVAFNSNEEPHSKWGNSSFKASHQYVIRTLTVIKD
jgi:hypothetical protein